jgi:hypothetical protein
MSNWRRFAAGNALPAWFSYSLYVLLVWCATAGVSALVLLCFDSYHPVTCALVATAASAAAWPFRPYIDADREPAPEPAHGAAGAAVAIVLVFLVFAGVSHSEHLLTDRDPAVYVNTGRSIARTHRIHPLVERSPFDNKAFTMKSAGYEVVFHRVYSNFFQFLPVLLAMGWSVGGDTGLLLVPALLGALGLLALYALATAVVGPRWALLGPALLVLAPLQSWFSRDAYAELPLQLLALGGLWLFIESRNEGGAIQGAIAGLILGSIIFVRIDALTVLVGLPVVFAVEQLRTKRLEGREDRRRRRASISFFFVALIAMVVGGTLVSRELSPGYLEDLGHNLKLLELAFAAGIAASIGIFVAHQRRAGIGRRLAEDRRLVWVAGGLAVAMALYAYLLRPDTGSAPELRARPSAPGVSRKVFGAFYYSSSFKWFVWYLGVFTVAFAVVGLISLGVRAMRSDSAALLLFAAALPVTLLYIARPSIAPDHLWAMRRYLPMVLPAMTIAAAAGAVWLTAAAGSWQPRLRAPIATLAVAAMIVPAAASGQPLLGAQMQGGALRAVHRICDLTGDDAAIAIEPFAFLGTELQQTMRSFCGVPAAAIKAENTVPLATFARAWKAEGRRLDVISAARRPVLKAAPDAVEIAHLVIADAREPNRTLGRRPREYAPRRVEMWLYRVDP